LNCLKQCLTENSFSRQEELIFHDCDARGRARLGTLLSLLAASAGHDYDARGLDYRKLYEIRQVFLLSRASLRIHRHPVTGDILTITTWENGTKGAHVRRNYEMADSNGALCVSAKSEWIIVDPESRRILRPDTFTGKALTLCPKEIDCSECRKVLLPREGLLDLGSRKIVYSDLDFNGHIYCGNYGDILWDALPADFQDARLREFAINYSREATLGEELRLKGFRDGSTFLAEGLCGGERCFTCACGF
jgi:acyl-ACP thioesterase